MSVFQNYKDEFLPEQNLSDDGHKLFKITCSVLKSSVLGLKVLIEYIYFMYI